MQHGKHEINTIITIAFSAHASKVMLKTLQAGLQQYVKLDLEKAEEPGIKLPPSAGS